MNRCLWYTVAKREPPCLLLFRVSVTKFGSHWLTNGRGRRLADDYASTFTSAPVSKQLIEYKYKFL